jgi:hypothetical protein
VFVDHPRALTALHAAQILHNKHFFITWLLMKSGEGFGSWWSCSCLRWWWWWGMACMFSVVLQYYTLCAGWVWERLAATDSLKPTLLRLVSSPGPAKIAANIPKHVWLLLIYSFISLYFEGLKISKYFEFFKVNLKIIGHSAGWMRPRA